MIPATISTMLSTTSPVTRPPKISVDNRKPPIGVRRQHLAGDRGRHHRQHLASTNYPDSVMISLRSSLDKLSAGARVIFGVAALLENTPFELYTLIRSGSARNASATMSRRTIWRSAEICRDHRVCRTRRWRREGAFCRAQGRQEVISNGASFTRVSNPVPLSSESENFRSLSPSRFR